MRVPGNASRRLDRIHGGAYPHVITVCGWSMTKLIGATKWCRQQGLIGVDWDYWPNPIATGSDDFYFLSEVVAVEFKLLFT